MADSKISALGALASTTDDDLLLVVDSTDPATATGMDKKMTVLNFLAPVSQAISDAIDTAEAYTDAPLTFNPISTTPYTFVSGDAGNVMVQTTMGTDQVLKIPTNASVPLPNGSLIAVTRTGAGLTTIDDSLIVAAGGALQGSITTVDQYGNVAILKLGTNTWLVLGGSSDGDTAGAASSTDGDIVQFSGITGKVLEDTGKSIDTDTSLAANSGSRVPTQHAVKFYADAGDATASLAPAAPIQLMVPVITNSMAVGAMSPYAAPGANSMRAMRCVVPQTGNLTKLAWYIGGTVAGNYIFSLYDTGAAVSGDFTRIWTSGTVACGASTTVWKNQTIASGTPTTLAVTRGQHVFAALSLDDATTVVGRGAATLPSGSAAYPPTTLLAPDGGDNTQYASFLYDPGSFTAPTSITQGSVSTTTFNAVFLGAVT